jgi:hypothetical protein
LASHTVRIELHEADEADYASLDEAMTEEGFVRWVVGAGGVKHRLPPGEYNLIDSDLYQSTILAQAQETAGAVKPEPTPSIVVTESAGRIWSGLKRWE